MSRIDPGTAERLQDAFTITVDASTSARHHAAIADAIRTVGVPPPATPARWRMRIPALVAAAMAVAPVGAAVAAENTNPGDLLYPVKRIVEPIRSIFDSDIAATHRIEELARIVDSPADIDRIPIAVSDARDALFDLPPDSSLRDEFMMITDRVRDHFGSDTPLHDEVSDDVRPMDEAPQDDGSKDVAPSDERPDEGEVTDTTVTEPGEHPTTTQVRDQRPAPVDPPDQETDPSPPDSRGDEGGDEADDPDQARSDG